MTDHSPPSTALQVTLFSFGFKYGPPTDVNMIWDVRFLPNPYWDESLRPLTGLTSGVSDFVLHSDKGAAFLQLLEPLFRFVIEENRSTGKETFKVAIGCTGGRHRSVAVVESLKAIVSEMPVALTLYHRDIERDNKL